MKAVISKVSSCFPSSEAAQEEVVGRDDIVAQLAALQHKVDKVMEFSVFNKKIMIAIAGSNQGSSSKVSCKC